MSWKRIKCLVETTQTAVSGANSLSLRVIIHSHNQIRFDVVILSSSAFAAHINQHDKETFFGVRKTSCYVIIKIIFCAK